MINLRLNSIDRKSRDWGVTKHKLGTTEILGGAKLISIRVYLFHYNIDYEPNGIPFDSKSKRKSSIQSFSFQFERKLISSPVSM